MHVMQERESDVQFVDRVETDDAYLGGEKASEPRKAGRGSPNNTPFVAAVEANELGHPQRIAMQFVDGFTLAEIADFARLKSRTEL